MPQSEYGRQKAEAEARLLKLGERVCVLRLTKVFPRNPPLLAQWLTNLMNSESIHPFHDLACSPLFVDQVAELLVSIARKKLTGIWRFSGDRDITYADIGCHLASRFDLDSRLVQAASVVTSSYHFEHIPIYTSLDCSRLETELWIKPPPVWKFVRRLWDHEFSVMWQVILSPACPPRDLGFR